jgi:cbb3-type cytochrome c oxidase subunit III
MSVAITPTRPQRILALCVMAAACKSGVAMPRRDDASVRAAAQLSALDAPAMYAKSCAPCHGDDAKGYKADHAPSLVNPTFLTSASDEFLHRSIVYGRPGTSMAPYGRAMGGPLDDAAIDRLVAWLRAKGPAAEALTAASVGDAARGATVYAQNCVKCHGTATTRGDAVQLANARFLDAATDAFLRYAIVRGRPGTPMDAWAGKLDDGQLDDVVAYVRAFAKPVEDHMLPAPTGSEPLVLHPGGKDPAFTLRADPCPPAAKGAAACKPDPRYVPAAEVKRALDEQRKLVIVDARPESEWRRAHITGAVSIPYVDMHRLSEVPDDVWVVAYCACPHHLSGIVVDELRKRGHARSAVLDEGILDWQRRSYPVVAAEGVTPPPAEAPHRR